MGDPLSFIGTFRGRLNRPGDFQQIGEEHRRSGLVQLRAESKAFGFATPFIVLPLWFCVVVLTSGEMIRDVSFPP